MSDSTTENIEKEEEKHNAYRSSLEEGASWGLLKIFICSLEEEANQDLVRDSRGELQEFPREDWELGEGPA